MIEYPSFIIEDVIHDRARNDPAYVEADDDDLGVTSHWQYFPRGLRIILSDGQEQRALTAESLSS